MRRLLVVIVVVVGSSGCRLRGNSIRSSRSKVVEMDLLGWMDEDQELRGPNKDCQLADSGEGAT